MTRRGVTLAELLIALVLAVVIGGLLGGMLYLSRKGEQEAERDAALEALVLAQERLAADLRCVAAAPGATALALDADARALGMWVWSPDGKPVPVTYRLQGPPDRREVVRTAAGRPQPVGAGLVRSIRFAEFFTPVGSMVRVTLEAEAAGVRRTATFVQRVRVPQGRDAQGLAFDAPGAFPDAELDPATPRPAFRVSPAGLPRR